MPVMDVWTFRRTQLATADLRDIPVVIVSASPPQAERDLVLAAAATISKPFKLAKLFDALPESLHTSRPTQTAA